MSEIQKVLGDYKDFWILKLDSDGNVGVSYPGTWQKRYTARNSDIARSVQETFDELCGNSTGYVIAGDNGSYPDSDFWVLKLDSDGNVTWQSGCGGSDNEHAKAIQQTFDGDGNPIGYIVAGHAHPICHTCPADAYIVKLDSDGNILWKKIYGGSETDVSSSVLQTFDQLGQPDGYIVAGYTNSFGADISDMWIFKIDDNGTIIWEKKYGGSGIDNAYSIEKTTDGNYIVAGQTESFGASDQDIWVLKLDSSGNIIWETRYGGNLDDYVHWANIHQTKDGGYIVAGTTTSFGAGNEDIFVLKLNNDGEIPYCDIITDTNASVSDTSASVSDFGTLSLPSYSVYNTSIDPQDSSAFIFCQCPDSDVDEIGDGCDNCPEAPNGRDLGTCVKLLAGMVVSYRVGDQKDFITCTSDADCEETGGACHMEQGDCNGNGCGDVCECYMDCNNSGVGDGKVTGADLAVLRHEYGRFDCDTPDPCYADGNKDGKVTGADLSLLKNEYGRFDCPACP